MQKMKQLWQSLLSKFKRVPGVNPPTSGIPQPQPQPTVSQPTPAPTVNQAPQLAASPKVVPAWRTILIGILTCAILTICLTGLLSGLIGTGWSAWLLSAMIAFGGVGVFGITPVEIQHTAVPLFFGRRISWFILEEGWNWLLPSPIMGVSIVDMRERVLRIGEKFGQDNDKGGELVAATIETPKRKKGQSDPRGDVRLVEMISRVTIMWIVENPTRFINVGEATIEGALTDLAVKTLRAKASKISDIKLIRSTDQFEDHVLKALIDDEDADTKEKMTSIYGIRIRRVIIPKVTHKDAATVKSYERVAQEKREKQAQELERTFLIESIEILMTRTGMTAEEATLAIQAQRNTSRRQELIIRAGKDVGDITKGAAVLQQGGGLFAPPAVTPQGDGLDAGTPP